MLKYDAADRGSNPDRNQHFFNRVRVVLKYDALNMWYISVCLTGVVVSMQDFHAVDWGSIPA